MFLALCSPPELTQFAIAALFADIFHSQRYWVGSRPGAPIKLLGIFLKELEEMVQLFLLLQHRKQDILSTRHVLCHLFLPHTGSASLPHLFLGSLLSMV